MISNSNNLQEIIAGLEEWQGDQWASRMKSFIVKLMVTQVEATKNHGNIDELAEDVNTLAMLYEMIDKLESLPPAAVKAA